MSDGRGTPCDRGDQCRRRGGAGAERGRDRHGVRHLRRPYGADLPRPGEAAERDPHRAGARGIPRRRDGGGLRPPARKTRRADRAGTVGARQRSARHAGSAPVVVADAAADGFLRSAKSGAACALSVRRRRLRRVGCAARVLGRDEAGVPGAGAGAGGAGDAVRDQARDVGPEGAGRGAVLVRGAERQGRSRHGADALSDAALHAAAAVGRRCSAGRARRRRAEDRRSGR